MWFNLGIGNISLHLRSKDIFCFPYPFHSHRNLGCKHCGDVSNHSLSNSISAVCRWVPGSAGVPDRRMMPHPGQSCPAQPRARFLLLAAQWAFSSSITYTTWCQPGIILLSKQHRVIFMKCPVMHECMCCHSVYDDFKGIAEIQNSVALCFHPPKKKNAVLLPIIRFLAPFHPVICPSNR